MDQQELRKLENLCIQECAPWCSASCPAHVDVRAMITALTKGDFDAALKVFQKSVPFPGIISCVCDHPCQDVCKRRQAGSAVSIHALERAVMTWASFAAVKVAPPLPKNKKVAIVGAGLSGLATSLFLAKKRYEVVVFEAADRVGGSLRDFPEAVLPRDVMLRDFEVLTQLNVEIRFNETVGEKISISCLQKDFEAVYLGSGYKSRFQIGLELNDDGLVSIDPVTLETNLRGTFAGGSLVWGNKDNSPILSISDGRRAAISIDRFA